MKGVFNFKAAFASLCVCAFIATAVAAILKTMDAFAKVYGPERMMAGYFVVMVLVVVIGTGITARKQ